VLGYAQASGSVTANTFGYFYPLALNVGPSTRCLVSVTGWLNIGSPLTGNNQTYPTLRVADAGNAAPTSYGCYFPAMPTGTSYSTCAYTYVANVTPNTDYRFGCALFSTANNGDAYCAVAASCY
jgi:hypothetical protein